MMSRPEWRTAGREERKRRVLQHCPPQTAGSEEAATCLRQPSTHAGRLPPPRVGSQPVEVIEMAKKVRDAMTAEPRTAEPTLSLVDAAQLMKSEDVGSLPIVEEGRLLAVLTDRDIAVRAVAEGVDPNAVVIGDVASRELVTVEPEQDLVRR